MKSFLKIIAILSFVGLVSADASPTLYQTVHYPDLGGNNYDLAFPCVDKTKKFFDSALAVDILKIWCDDKLLEPIEETGSFHYSFRTTESDTSFIYRLKTSSLIVSKKETEKVDSSRVIRYIIPPKVRHLKVEYRILLPTWRYTDVMIVESYDVIEVM